MKTLVLVNPASARGKTGQQWPRLEPEFRRILGDFELATTTRAQQATELTRAALLAGTERVICVGGDGTNHEVVQGFFDPQTRRALNPDACFAFVPRGTGRDLGRSWQMGTELGPQLQRIADSPIHQMDLISCEFTTAAGLDWHVSLNAASFGQGGDLVHRVDRWKWTGGGGLPFVLAGIEGAMFVKPWEIELRIDDGPWERDSVRNLGAFNGRFQGGGMEFAPQALLNDGVLEVFALGSVGAVKSVAVGIASFYKNVDGMSGVWTRQARRIEVRPISGQAPMWVELDGESPGTAPACFEVMPSALRVAL